MMRRIGTKADSGEREKERKLYNFNPFLVRTEREKKRKVNNFNPLQWRTERETKGERKKRKKIRIRSESKSENSNFSEVFFGELGDSNHFYRVRPTKPTPLLTAFTPPQVLLSHPPVAAATPPILFYCQIQAFDLPKCIMREKQRLIDLLITN